MFPLPRLAEWDDRPPEVLLSRALDPGRKSESLKVPPETQEGG